MALGMFQPRGVSEGHIIVVIHYRFPVFIELLFDIAGFSSFESSWMIACSTRSKLTGFRGGHMTCGPNTYLSNLTPKKPVHANIQSWQTLAIYIDNIQMKWHQDGLEMASSPSFMQSHRMLRVFVAAPCHESRCRAVCAKQCRSSALRVAWDEMWYNWYNIIYNFPPDFDAFEFWCNFIHIILIHPVTVPQKKTQQMDHHQHPLPPRRGGCRQQGPTLLQVRGKLRRTASTETVQLLVPWLQFGLTEWQFGFNCSQPTKKLKKRCFTLFYHRNVEDWRKTGWNSEMFSIF